MAQIQPEFGLTAVTTGYVLSAYAWSYTALQLVVGPMLDRFGVRRVGSWAALLWSVACAATGMAHSVGVLFGARILLGIAEAPTFPGNAKAIEKWFPRDRRGLPTSIFDSAAKFASAIGVPLMALLVYWRGWRFCLFVTAALSLLYWFAFVRWYREPAESLGPITATGTVPLLRLVRQRKVVAISLALVASNYSFYLLLTWLPQYLHTALHLDVLHAGGYTAVPWAFATLSDLLIAGWLVDALIARGISATRVRKAVMISGLLLALAIGGAARAHTPAGATFWITIALVGLATAGPVMWTLPGLIAPPNATGTVGGVMNFAGNLSGIVAPIVTGYIVGATGSFARAFAVAAALLLIGLFAVAVLLGKIELAQLPNDKARLTASTVRSSVPDASTVVASSLL